MATLKWQPIPQLKHGISLQELLKVATGVVISCYIASGNEETIIPSSEGNQQISKGLESTSCNM